jgi:hypothetical protein
MGLGGSARPAQFLGLDLTDFYCSTVCRVKFKIRELLEIALSAGRERHYAVIFRSMIGAVVRVSTRSGLWRIQRYKKRQRERERGR